jgi:hypothetical protein
MTAIATRRVMAAASLVASVILANKSPYRRSAAGRFSSTPDGIFVSAAGSDITI